MDLCSIITICQTNKKIHIFICRAKEELNVLKCHIVSEEYGTHHLTPTYFCVRSDRSGFLTLKHELWYPYPTDLLGEWPNFKNIAGRLSSLGRLSFIHLPSKLTSTAHMLLGFCPPRYELIIVLSISQYPRSKKYLASKSNFISCHTL